MTDPFPRDEYALDPQHDAFADVLPDQRQSLMHQLSLERQERATHILRALYRGRKLLTAVAVSEQDLRFLAAELGVEWEAIKE